MGGDVVTRPKPSRTRTTATVGVLAQQQLLAVAFGQPAGPRGLVEDLGQATETPHGLSELVEIEYGTKLGL